MARRYLEKPKTVLASETLVKEFVEMEPASGDRPLSERRLQVYRRILNAGEFRTVIWASAHCKETAGVYRVNGKHTNVLLAGLKPLPDFHVTIERYDCDSLQDVANLYNTFDSNLASRSASDINWSFASTIKELEGCPGRVVDLTVRAASFHEWGDEGMKRVPPAERAEQLIDRYNFALWMWKTMGFRSQQGGKAHAHVLRGPVVTAMFATHIRSPRVATDFWKQVVEESAPDNQDPTRVLSRYLVRAVLAGSTSRGRGAGKKMADFREIYVKCVHAWNAWRKGEKTALNYHANADLPDVSK
jgi:hypothetical protein